MFPSCILFLKLFFSAKFHELVRPLSQVSKVKLKDRKLANHWAPTPVHCTAVP